MPHRVWRPNIYGVRYTAVARWSPWTYEGELVLDRDIIRTWGARPAGSDITFEIERHPAFLRNDLIGFDLYVDGNKVPHSLV